MHGMDAAAADMLQDRRCRQVARADDNIDAERGNDAVVGLLVQKGDHPAGAVTLGEDRREDVGFVVIGQRNDGIGRCDSSLLQDIGCQHVTDQDDGVGEHACDLGRPLRLQLNDLDGDGRQVTLDLLRQQQRDRAATADQEPARGILLVPERCHGAADDLGFHDEIDVIATRQLIIAGKVERLVAAHDADDLRVQVREQLRQLLDRRVEERALRAAMHAQETHLVVGERQHLERTGYPQAVGDGARDLDLWRNNDVDRQVCAGEQPRPRRIQVALLADAGDLDRDLEQGMGDLAGDHVDFVGVRHGDQHVGLAGARTIENIRPRGMADDPLRVEPVADAADQFGRGIDDRDVVVLACQLTGDVEADLPGTADDDPHRLLPIVPAAGRSRRAGAYSCAPDTRTRSSV